MHSLFYCERDQDDDEMGTDLVFWDWFVKPKLWVGGHLSPTHLPGGNETNNVLGRGQHSSNESRVQKNKVCPPIVPILCLPPECTSLFPLEFKWLLSGLLNWATDRLHYIYSLPTTVSFIHYPFTNIDTDWYFVHGWWLLPSFNVAIVIAGWGIGCLLMAPTMGCIGIENPWPVVLVLVLVLQKPGH